MANEAEIIDQIMLILKQRPDGISRDELQLHTEHIDQNMRMNVINRLLNTNVIELLHEKGTTNFVIRIKKQTTKIENATLEEQQVYSHLEEANKNGIWIRDLREKTGLSEALLKKVLKNLEQRKLVKSVKAAGTMRKTYMLYEIEADDKVTGGKFYEDQQLDTKFVQDLMNFCVGMIVNHRRLAESQTPNNIFLAKEASFISIERITQFINSKGICKVPITESDVERILDVAVLDGRLEKRSDEDSYRAINITKKPPPTALAKVPCLQCPVANECTPGHLISPETCEYFTNWLNSF